MSIERNDTMKQHDRALQITGLLLLVGALLLYPFSSAMFARGQVVGLLYGSALYFLMALALCMLKVVKPAHAPLSYLVPGLVTYCFFLMPVLFDRTEAAQSWMLQNASPLGYVMIGLLLALGVWRAVQQKSSKGFAPMAAIALFAMAMLASFYPLINTEMARVTAPSREAKYLFGQMYSLVYCFLLFPLLQKHRRGGIALACFGGVCLLVHLLVEFSPLGSALEAMRQGGGFLQDYTYSVLKSTLGIGHAQLFMTFLLGGIWCTFPPKWGEKKA